MRPHKSGRGRDRPDGQEEQPEEVTLQSSNHDTPRGSYSRKVSILTPKPCPEQDRGGPTLQPPALACPTRWHRNIGCLPLGETPGTGRQTCILLKRLSTGWSISTRVMQLFSGRNYSMATLGCTATLQPRRGNCEATPRNARGRSTIPSKHISWQHTTTCLCKRDGRAPQGRRAECSRGAWVV